MQKWILCAAVLTLVACDQDPAAWPEGEAESDTDPVNTFVLRSRGGQVLEVSINDTEMLGPDVSVSRYVNARETVIRGRMFRTPVDLAVTTGKVAGVIGNGPMQISVTTEGGQVRAQGVIGGRLSDFTFSTQAVRGTFGACSYDLALVGRLYEGHRSCGLGSEEVWMQVPISLGRWTQPEVAASLGILLGGFG